MAKKEKKKGITYDELEAMGRKILDGTIKSDFITVNPDFIKKKKKTNNKYMPYEEYKAFIQTLGLKSSREYKEWVKKTGPEKIDKLINKWRRERNK